MTGRTVKTRRWVGIAVAATLAAAVPAGPAGAGPAADETCCTVSPDYVAAVDAALRSGTDLWGEQVMRRPDGVNYDALADYLVPVNGGGVASGEPGSGYKGSTDTGAYFLPLTMPDGDTATVQASTDPNRQHYALPLSDGAGIMADYHVPCDGEPGNTLPDFLARCGNFYATQLFVGTGADERFGQDGRRAPLPTLYHGYLPVLQTAYTDSDGVAYQQVTFAARIPQTSSLVAYTTITVRPQDRDRTRIRLHVKDPRDPALQRVGNTLGTADGTYLAFSGDPESSAADLTWTVDPRRGAAITTAMLITPTTLSAPGSVVTPGAVNGALAQVTRYWEAALNQGAGISVPEPYVLNALRSIAIQNLVMGWRTSVGNGYEDGYVPEDTDAVTSLLDFGFVADAKANLQVLLNTSRGTTRYPSWANGTKLEGLSHYYRSTGDADLVRHNLPLVTTILDGYATGQSGDPYGLLPRDSCCEDNGEAAYWFHGQAVAWRGLVDVLPVLRAVGETSLADKYQPVADRFGAALRTAIDASAVRLDDGSLFVPERLYSGDQPYARITATRAGSYWNLLVPYGLAAGILSPQQLTDALAYIHSHGGTLLGQTRFNWQGEPVGACNPANLPGYYGEGADELYGWQYANALADAGQPDRLNLTFYGKLAHSTTRNTFISGEGTDFEPCPWQYYRQMWWSPMSTSGSVFLNALRQQLVHETRTADGAIDAVTLAPATPRGWLADGKAIAVSQLPTLAGPVSYRITSNVADHKLQVTVQPPTHLDRARLLLRLRLPGGQNVTAAWVHGDAVPVDTETGTIDLTGQSGPLQITVRTS